MDLVHRPFIRDDPSRADRAWDWRWQIPLLLFAGLARRPRMFQLCLCADDFPIGMVALLENERWIDEPDQSAVFVWYLSGAPSRSVEHRGAPKLVTSAALDIAVTVSLSGMARGRLWLHAAPEGGDKLLDWYLGRGMDRVGSDLVLPGPRIGERVNDGRYFQLTPSSAVTVSTAMDPYRN